MKRKYKIILILLLALLVVNILIITTWRDAPVTTEIGNNTNGTVNKTICGNQNSNETVVIILGVHNLESGIHNATYDALMNLSTNSSELDKKYVVYFIHLNESQDGISEYSSNRMMGQLLAHDFIVKDVSQYNPFLVVDVHEMEDYWDPQEYIEPISNTSSANNYANTIGKNMSVMLYNFTEGTSPPYITEPLAKQGFDTILFETAQNDTAHDKQITAYELIRAIDNLKFNA